MCNLTEQKKHSAVCLFPGPFEQALGFGKALHTPSAKEASIPKSGFSSFSQIFL
jgi:hypothetical protein